MQPTFHRDRFTWLAYLGFGIYVYFLNALGPITPFLKDELHLSYTVSSFHFSAFAIGMLLVGMGGHYIIPRIGKNRSMWLGLIGTCLGALVLIAFRNPIVTISAAFLMGTIGSVVIAIIPATLADHHSEMKDVAVTEANVSASLFATAAPLFVGWSARFTGEWRWALGLMTVMPIILYLSLGRDVTLSTSSSAEEMAPRRKHLPMHFWLLWLALVLAVSVEFCMIFWGADYFEQVLRLSKANAAQSIGLFTAAMIVGRLLGSRIVQQFSSRAMVAVSVLVAGVGFLLFWLTYQPIIGQIGFFITGLGIANMYPFIIGLMINAADGDGIQAGSRSTLASGTAILTLPLLLGRLADATGIRLAYGVILVLLVSIWVIIQIAHKPTEKTAAPFSTS